MNVIETFCESPEPFRAELEPHKLFDKLNIKGVASGSWLRSELTITRGEPVPLRELPVIALATERALEVEFRREDAEMKVTLVGEQTLTGAVGVFTASLRAGVYPWRYLQGTLDRWTDRRAGRLLWVEVQVSVHGRSAWFLVDRPSLGVEVKRPSPGELEVGPRHGPGGGSLFIWAKGPGYPRAPLTPISKVELKDRPQSFAVPSGEKTDWLVAVAAWCPIAKRERFHFSAGLKSTGRIDPIDSWERRAIVQGIAGLGRQMDPLPWWPIALRRHLELRLHDMDVRAGLRSVGGPAPRLVGPTVQARHRCWILNTMEMGRGYQFFAGHGDALASGQLGDWAAFKHTFPPGAELGGYRIAKHIKSGGQADVYKATDPQGVQVALKVLKWEHRDNEIRRPRWEREKRILQMGLHDAIVRFVASIDDAEAPALVIEWIDGPTLNELIEDEKQDRPSWLELARFLPVLEAVEALHDQPKPLVHRDIKPDNILVAGLPNNPTFKLIDFGIAFETGQRDSRKTIGTHGFIPPEVLLDPEDNGPWIDIYQLGLTMLAYLRKVDASSISGLRPEEVISGLPLPRPIRAALYQATCAKRERFGTCAKFREALADALRTAERARGIGD